MQTFVLVEVIIIHFDQRLKTVVHSIISIRLLMNLFSMTIIIRVIKKLKSPPQLVTILMQIGTE